MADVRILPPRSRSPFAKREPRMEPEPDMDNFTVDREKVSDWEMNSNYGRVSGTRPTEN